MLSTANHSWIDETIERFGEAVGVGRLRLEQERALCFAFERSGHLFLERQEGEILIYLTREIPTHDDRWIEEALRICDFDERWQFQLSAALKDDWLLFLIRLDERELTIPVLETAIDLLMRLHERARA